jgi:anthranilate synthase component 1
MFCLNFGDDFALVGSSPEMHVRLTGNTVEIRPIAGTRPRGGTANEDEANARELLADPKERAEHIMLVDLARNDVDRGFWDCAGNYSRPSNDTATSCTSSRT